MAFLNNFTGTNAIPYATTQLITFGRGDSSTISLVGRALEFTVQDKDNPTVALVSKTTALGTVSILSADAFTVMIGAADTILPNGIGTGIFQYTVRATDPGAEDILAYGDFEIAILSPAP